MSYHITAKRELVLDTEPIHVPYNGNINRRTTSAGGIDAEADPEVLEPWRETETDLFSEYISKYSEKGELPDHPTRLVESCTLPPSGTPLASRGDGGVIDKKCIPNGISRCQFDAVILSIISFQKEMKPRHPLPTWVGGVGTTTPVRVPRAETGVKQGFFIGDGTGAGKGRTIAAILSYYYNKGNKVLWISTSSDLYEDAKRDFHALSYDSAAHEVPDVTLFPTTKEWSCGFTTYSTLTSDKKYKMLVEQLSENKELVIAFDECHRGKNINTSSLNSSPKTAVRMIELQRHFPSAKILYVSATGCSEIKHMGYMERLGLWGFDHSPQGWVDFKQFQDSMKKGGELANELVSLHLSCQGQYISRHLSFEGVQFNTKVIEVEQHELYTHIYSLYVDLFECIRNQLFTDFSATEKIQYWGMTLRCMKSLIMSFKVKDTIKYIHELLKDSNNTIIINVQCTGESYIDERTVAEAKQVIQSSPLHIIRRYCNGLTQKPPEELTKKLESIEEYTNGKHITHNPLDSIIHEFDSVVGVAELTGRRQRITKHGTIESRRQGCNLIEKELFMNGKKRIAILSDASSTGISLHSTSESIRHHIILELPWSAEQFIQQCGRSHRSSQMNKPIYTIMVTDIDGEKRFISTISKRLRTLGALTCGNRNCRMYGIDSELESSKHAPKVIKSMIRAFGQRETNEFELFKSALTGNTVKTFMNKLLVINVKRQRQIMEEFNDKLSKLNVISDVISDIKSKDTTIIETTSLGSPSTSRVSLHKIALRTGITFDECVSLIKRRTATEEAMFVLSPLHPDLGKARCFFATKHSRGGAGVGTDKYRLHTSTKYNYCTVDSLDGYHYVADDQIEEAKRLWAPAMAATTGPLRSNTKHIHVVCGDLLAIWIKIQDNTALSAQSRRLKRILLAGGETVMGFVIPEHNILQIKQILQHC